MPESRSSWTWCTTIPQRAIKTGPTLCFRGLANEAYYILEPNRALYANYTGCGNTLNANEPICRRLIIDSLRYWVSEMHVDGFRFDLASILSRDTVGRPLANPPILWDIESDPVLANVKLIAEAWDAAGLYQVGSFVGDSWKEWNGRFRDDVRAFIKGDNGMAGPWPIGCSAARICIGTRSGSRNRASISSPAMTDSPSTTWSLTIASTTRRTGRITGTDPNDNLSWNCGVEGPTDDREVERLRNRQVKNFLRR